MSTELETKYVRIYADKVESNISGFDFSYDYIVGDKGKATPTHLYPLSVVFFDGSKLITRNFEKHEDKQSALVLARLAFQVFEDKLDSLTDEERRTTKTDGTPYTIGLWSDREALKKKWGNGENAGRQPKVDY